MRRLGGDEGLILQRRKLQQRREVLFYRIINGWFVTWMIILMTIWLTIAGIVMRRLNYTHNTNDNNPPTTSHRWAKENMMRRSRVQITTKTTKKKTDKSHSNPSQNHTNAHHDMIRKNKQQHQHRNISKQQHHQIHSHIIPNVLIFTYFKNLLDPNVALDDEEEIALQANVKSIVQAHTTPATTQNASSSSSSPTVRFLTNDDCQQSIVNVMGIQSPLVDYFIHEPKGMFRADICRGAALYETGGLYLDVDVGLVIPYSNNNKHIQHPPNLWTYLQRNTTFATVYVHEQSHHRGNFFQAFIASSPKNPIMYRYLQLFVEYYREQKEQQQQGVDGLQTSHNYPLYSFLHGKPLGVILLRMAYDDVVLRNNLVITQPTTPTSRNLDDPNHNMSLTTANVQQHHHEQVVELWQEVLYHPSLFPHIPPPIWGGKKRACHFVVVVSMNPKQLQPQHLQVPLYSRIAGSRQCRVQKPNLEE